MRAFDPSAALPRGARWVESLVEGRTASTSYFLRASAGESGRPDQITEEGSRGGMKRVSLLVGIW